jgi:hypothetical protein
MVREKRRRRRRRRRRKINDREKHIPLFKSSFQG